MSTPRSSEHCAIYEQKHCVLYVGQFRAEQSARVTLDDAFSQEFEVVFRFMFTCHPLPSQWLHPNHVCLLPPPRIDALLG